MEKQNDTEKTAITSNGVLAEVKPLLKRGHPCICVSCPNCGNVFMGAIFSAGLMINDKELMQELEQYARDGYTIDVRNAKEFKLYSCKCELCVG